MSINRAVLALGAVAVVGVATVGASAALANHYGKPVPKVAVTTGANWTQIAPTADCYNSGKPLTAAQQKACGASYATLFKAGKLKTITVAPNADFSITMDKIGADEGWSAVSIGSQPVAQTTKQYAGNLSAAALISTANSAEAQAAQQAGASSAPATMTSVPVQVTEGDGTNIYGLWYFLIKQNPS